MGEGDLPISAFGCKEGLGGKAVWLILGRGDIGPASLGQLMGMLMLDEVEQVLHPGFMPPRPSTVMCLDNGQLQGLRGLSLAPWALAESKRLGALLERDHAEYLGALLAALHQQDATGFAALAPGQVFKDTLKSARIGPRPPHLEVDTSQSERARYHLRWDQVVRLDYRRNRYLSGLSDGYLSRRLEDIVANVHTVDAHGLISVDVKDPVLFYWMSRLTEVDEELSLRDGPYPSGWKGIRVNFDTMPASLKPGQKEGIELDGKPRSPDKYFVKYGKRVYLERALEQGVIRIAAASSYSDPSLNPSIRDDELGLMIAPVSQPPFDAQPVCAALVAPHRKPIDVRMESDYLVFCASEVLARRLLFDFEADSCLLIHDPTEFSHRIDQAVRDAGRDWIFLSQSVEYLDPLAVSLQEVKLPLTKHFRYAYQREHRLAWIPSSACPRIDAMTVELGSLQDIAELVLPSATGRRPGGT